MKGLISIIVPIYNAELFLHRCVDSILSQTYTNLEIILVDDGSKDSTLKICKEYETKDNRIVVLHKENGGQSTARNEGLNIAKGEFIGFVDSDDYIKPTMFEILYNSIMFGDYDIAVCGIEMNTDGTSKNLLGQQNDIIIEGTENIVDKFLDGRMGFGPVNKLFRREIFQDNRFKAGIIFEDFELLSRLILKMNAVRVTSSMEYVYIVNHDSTTKSTFSSSKMNLIDVTTAAFEKLSKQYPRLEEKAFRLMIMDHFAILNWITRENVVREYKEEYKSIKTKIFRERKRIFRNRCISLGYKMLTFLCLYLPPIYRLLIRLREQIIH